MTRRRTKPSKTRLTGRRLAPFFPQLSERQLAAYIGIARRKRQKLSHVLGRAIARKAARKFERRARGAVDVDQRPLYSWDGLVARQFSARQDWLTPRPMAELSAAIQALIDRYIRQWRSELNINVLLLVRDKYAEKKLWACVTVEYRPKNVSHFGIDAVWDAEKTAQLESRAVETVSHYSGVVGYLALELYSRDTWETPDPAETWHKKAVSARGA
jgi:hypothetical protein